VRWPHPFQAAIEYINLIAHFELDVQHLALSGGIFATNTLTNLATDRLTQVRSTLVFDIRGFEFVSR
jgi:hypothetical protein